MVKDRVVQMAVKLVIEPLFEADFLPCSFGFRPQRTPRMALNTIVQSIQAGHSGSEIPYDRSGVPNGSMWSSRS